MIFEVFFDYLAPDEFERVKSVCMNTDMKYIGLGDERYTGHDTLELVQKSTKDFRFVYKQGEVTEEVKNILDFDIQSCFVSCYTSGCFLTRHRDGCKGDKAFILYLNDVPVEDGGALMIDGVHRVQPRENMLVVMDTGILHEVLPVIRGERWAIAGWFFLPK